MSTNSLNVSQQLKSILPLILWMLAASVSCQTLKQDSVMPTTTIRFIPETFNDLKVGAFHGGRNPCSPMSPEKATSYLMNETLINVPEKIILPSSVPLESIKPIIPVCVASVFTARRGAKYAHLSEGVFHIRKTDSEHWFKGIIYEELWDEGEMPGPAPDEEVVEKRRKEREKQIAKAQQYTDDELNEGNFSGEYRNLNLMQYVDMPFEPGVYELYYSALGIESNRVQVEIVCLPFF
ncbi:hypothetical protein [Geofilum rubicundum]|uniref:Uncharacterized protein n=1 Tax=Geofilum rubicundum JCM 15548 TaxID=1236989 RepID=A0A0E9M2U2_9BACT|nr:hypothetical protein [Geofilum rubicundum]GAO31716.1 hypothetical protein JCM15548_14107 [Geofilum rubicundum JCM 15548]